MELTPIQILQIYEAGIRRGNEEAVAYEWGVRASGHKLDELEDTFLWEGIDSIIQDLDYDQKNFWWKQFKAEI
jgi:hypothetical protein